MTTLERVGQRIRSERAKQDLTLQRLATTAKIDVSQLSKVERGLISTDLDTFARIAKGLGLTISSLFRS